MTTKDKITELLNKILDLDHQYHLARQEFNDYINSIKEEENNTQNG